MTLIWTESFDGPSPLDKYPVGSAGFIIDTGHNGQGLTLDAGAANTLLNKKIPIPGDFQVAGTYTFGADFMFTDLSVMNVNLPIFEFMPVNDALRFAMASVDTDGSVKICDSSGLPVASSAPGAIQEDVWVYIQVQVVMDNSAGFIRLKINFEDVIEVDSLDTLTGSEDFGHIYFYIDKTGLVVPFVTDNWYLLNSDGDSFNDFLGTIRLEAIYPDGNGGGSAWTGSDADSVDNYLLVNDLDQVATYVENDVDDSADLYTFSAMDDNSGVVLGVVLNAYGNVEEEPRQLRAVSYDGSNFLTSDAQDMDDNARWHQFLFETGPDFDAWVSGAQVDANEFGIQPGTA